MIVIFRWARAVLSFCFFIVILIVAINYRTSVYLVYQASGQLYILLNTASIAGYETKNNLSAAEKENLLLVEKIKKFSVEELGFTPTKNFTTIYNQQNTPVLWVITACEPFTFNTVNWKFPLVGSVSYKGFFKKSLAEKEYNHLIAQGYDVDLRSASAWSTLGWFNDPLLSNTLHRSKGGLCNLLFHELFHATYYAAGSVDLNENLANFIAHKATLLFLKDDKRALKAYLENNSDNDIFTAFMLRQKAGLTTYYGAIVNRPNKQDLKLVALAKIADSIAGLPLVNKPKFTSRKSEILKFKNAYFVDFQQYESMQDSLEQVFNKIYKGNLQIMVRYLKSNKINY